MWTWTALCADTKLVASWFVGSRDMDSATSFLADLRDRLASRVQLTSDGDRVYLAAVEETFGNEIDYAQLVKLNFWRVHQLLKTTPAVACGVADEPWKTERLVRLLEAAEAN